MDWIKIKTNHVNLEFCHWPDNVFRAWIRAMCFCAGMERLPDSEQINNYLGKDLTQELTNALTKSGVTLEYVLGKVYEDVEKTVKEREYSREYMRPYRDKKKEAITGEPSFTNEIFKYFSAKYVEKLGKCYIASYGKDKKLIKDMLGQATPERIKGLIDKFFERTDDFVKKAGYTVGVFKSCANSLEGKTVKAEVRKQKCIYCKTAEATIGMVCSACNEKCKSKAKAKQM